MSSRQDAPQRRPPDAAFFGWSANQRASTELKALFRHLAFKITPSTDGRASPPQAVFG
jgi:hypothetical protein